MTGGAGQRPPVLSRRWRRRWKPGLARVGAMLLLVGFPTCYQRAPVGAEAAVKGAAAEQAPIGAEDSDLERVLARFDCVTTGLDLMTRHKVAPLDPVGRKAAAETAAQLESLLREQEPVLNAIDEIRVGLEAVTVEQRYGRAVEGIERMLEEHQRKWTCQGLPAGVKDRVTAQRDMLFALRDVLRKRLEAADANAGTRQEQLARMSDVVLSVKSVLVVMFDQAELIRLLLEVEVLDNRSRSLGSIIDTFQEVERRRKEMSAGLQRYFGALAAESLAVDYRPTTGKILVVTASRRRTAGEPRDYTEERAKLAALRRLRDFVAAARIVENDGETITETVDFVLLGARVEYSWSGREVTATIRVKESKVFAGLSGLLDGLAPGRW